MNKRIITFRNDDYFSRKRYAQFAMSLVSNRYSEDNACTIAIDAPVGMGKTTFIHMWKNELELCSRSVQDKSLSPLFESMENISIYYNAWENDYSCDAFFPLVFSICGELKKACENKGWKEDGKRLLADIVGCAAGIGASYLLGTSPQTINPELIGSLAGNVINGFLHLFQKKDIQTIGEVYQSQKENRQTFRRTLCELVQENGKIFIFIDELDRCIPSFAIRTLEVIKHFFDIPGIVFVFGIDATQLSYSIAGAYGSGINSYDYLGRYFDYNIKLPTPSANEILGQLYPHVTNNPMFEKIVDEIIAACEITPHDMSAILCRFECVWNEISDRVDKRYVKTMITMVLSLIALQRKMPRTYWEYINASLTWDERNWASTHPLLYRPLHALSCYLTQNLHACKNNWRIVDQSYDFEKQAIADTFSQVCMDYEDELVFREFISNLINSRL